MSPADALVLFGATGDLAFKMIFPALAGLVKRRRRAARSRGSGGLPAFARHLPGARVAGTRPKAPVVPVL